MVVNFDESPAEIGIQLPAHAFDFLEVAEKDSVKATDLLTGNREEIAFTSTRQVRTQVAGFSGKILKVKL